MMRTNPFILVFLFWLWYTILWQAQYAWLMNINVRLATAYRRIRGAMGLRNAQTVRTKVTVPVKEASSNVTTGLALILPSAVTVSKIVNRAGKMR